MCSSINGTGTFFNVLRDLAAQIVRKRKTKKQKLDLLLNRKEYRESSEKIPSVKTEEIHLSV